MRAIDRLLRHRPTAGGMSLAGKIRALFSNGEQGWWYDPSNFATLFQDSAGTTPVTAVEQPVGLQLDLSKGLVLGPELVTNGDFATDTWWSKGTGCTISGGSANFAAASGYVLSRLNVSGIAVGGFYEVTFTVTNYVSGSIRPYLGATPTFGTSVSANGTYTVRFGPTAGAEIGFNSASAFTGSIDNVSIKQVTGNHRFQSTSANRPVVSARVNLLTKTEDFSDAAWPKNALTVTANATTAPDGTTTADLAIPTTANAEHYLDIAPISFVSGTEYKISVAAKIGGYRWLRLAFNSSVTPASNRAAWFDLQNGVLGTVQSGVTATIVPDNNGFYRCSISRAATSSATPSQSGFIQITNADNVASSFAGDGTSGIYLWGADLRPTNQGVGLPAYQRVNTSTDYDAVGFPVYIKPNGSNQFMVTNSINFTATDKMTVWQGVRKLSDAEMVLAETSVAWFSNNGTFASNTWNSPSGYSSALRGNSSTPYFYKTSAFAAPVTNVVATSYDIAGATSETEVQVRVNATATTLTVAGGSSLAGTGNFGTYPAYFYMRAGLNLPFNGHDYGSIARGAASTAAQITAGETWINQRTKAY